HDFHGCLCDRLVREKIQLKAFSQRRVIDIADAALPGGTGVRNHNVHPAMSRNDGIKSAGNRSGLSHVTADTESTERFGGEHRAGRVKIKESHLRTARAKGSGCGKPDGPGAAGDDDNVSLER